MIGAIKEDKADAISALHLFEKLQILTLLSL
jgi:hypothetical protein